MIPLLHVTLEKQMRIGVEGDVHGSVVARQEFGL